MAYAYKNNYNKGPSKSAPAGPKIIYAEDEVYVREAESGWFIFHTTLDPSVQYKQRTIGVVSEKPEKQYIIKKIRYGPNMDKLKFLLDKQKLKDILDEEFDYDVSDEPSPWAPKKLGAGSNKRQKTDSDTDDESTTTTSTKTATTNTDLTELIKKVDDCYLLLTELITHKRQEEQTLSTN